MKIFTALCSVLVFTICHAIADGTNHDWELVRSVPDSFGGTNDYVVIPQNELRNLTNYQAAASAVAGTRDTCFIFFWTNRTDVPTSEWMADTNMQTLTATYERYPGYKAPQFRLACWLYPSVDAATSANAFFMPGVTMPQTAAATNKAPNIVTKP